MAENKWVVDGHHYMCPDCKKTIAIVVNESDEGFEFCPFCGKRMSGQRATDKHMWAGCECLAHLNNIKCWQERCGDHIENTLMDAVKLIYSMTYGVSPLQASKDELWPVVKEVTPKLIEEMRKNDIPVWNPEADNDEF